MFGNPNGYGNGGGGGGAFPTVNFPGVASSINPPDSQLSVNPGVQWKQVPMGEPCPWVPFNQEQTIGTFTRMYSVNVSTPTDVAAGTEALKTIQIDIPGAVIELMGAACKTDGNALPVGWETNDAFLLRVDHSQGDKLITQSTLGSAVCGTAQRPKKIPGNGWKFGRGSTIVFFITPRLNNLRVDIAITYLEFRAGANFGQLS
jgi:hypothetical protein